MDTLRAYRDGTQKLKNDSIAKKIQELRSELTYYDLMYYVFKEPQVSDATYSLTKQMYEKLCRDNPVLSKQSPRARSVAEQIANNRNEIKHDFPMLNLREVSDLHALKRTFDVFDVSDGLNDGIIVEPSIEGIEVELVYVGGHLHKAVSYGDGLIGGDITLNMYSVKGVPQQIPELERVNIHGRVTMATIDRMQLKHGPEYGTAQVVAYSLYKNFGPDKLPEAEHLQFIPHNVNIPGSPFSLTDLRRILGLWDFETTPAWVLNGKVREIGAIEEGIEAFEAKELKGYLFPFDGLVFKVNDTQRRLELGYTSRFPEWAVKLIRGKSNGRVQGEVADQSTVK